VYTSQAAIQSHRNDATPGKVALFRGKTPLRMIVEKSEKKYSTKTDLSQQSLKKGSDDHFTTKKLIDFSLEL